MTKKQLLDQEIKKYYQLVDYLSEIMGVSHVIVFDAKTGIVHENPIFGLNGLNTIQITINESHLDKPKKPKKKTKKKTHATKKTTKK